MGPQRTNRLYWGGIAVLTALWAILHARVLLGHQVFALLDASQFFFPYWKWGGEILKQGTIPLWNSSVGFGTPYLADPQMAAWYPPRVLAYVFLNPIDAFDVLILAHHLWALVGFWTFARHRGLGFWASLGGTLVFGFSFTAVSLTSITPMIFTFSWIPWILLGVDKVWEKRGSGFWLLASAMGMQLASGYPLHFYLTLLFLSFDVAMRFQSMGILTRVKKWPWAFLGSVVVAVLFALCLNMAWIIPLQEMVPATNLAKRQELWDANHLNFLKTWLDPFALGHPLHSSNPSVFAYSVYYVGLPPLVLFLWSVWRRKVKWTDSLPFFALIALSLGETAWVGGWLKSILPGYRYVVRSGYWLPFVVCAAAMLTAKTLGSMRIGGTGKADKPWFFLTGCVFFCALVLGVPWELPGFWMSFILTLAFGMSFKFPGEIRPAIVALAILFSLGPVDRAINFSMPRDFYETKPPISGQLTKPGRLYVSLKTLDKNERVSGDSTEGIHHKMKDNLIPNWPLALGLEESFGGNPIFLQTAFRWCFYPSALFPVTAGKSLDYLGIRYVFGEKPQGSWVELKDPSLADRVWENSRTLPKWFSVTRAFAEKGEALDWKRMGEKGFDLARTGFVQDGSKAGPYSPRRVSELGRDADHVELEAAGRGRAFLVSSETAYPGWELRVEGKEHPLERVNLGFRGFALEDGEQKAEMTYRPRSFKLGCFLSLLAAGPWLALGVLLPMLRRMLDANS